jgi:Ras-related GTP-binding protein A/B
MDKVDQSKRDAIFSNRQKQFESKIGNFTLKCFPTSIWEATLYKAWSFIIGSIVPNIERIKELLGKYAIACKADEVILFEKNTFLNITSFSGVYVKTDERIEKICIMMKKFKSACRNDSKKFNHFLIQNIKNTIYLDEFLNNTCIMIVLSDKKISLEFLKINLQISKKSFKEIMDS